MDALGNARWERNPAYRANEPVRNCYLFRRSDGTWGVTGAAADVALNRCDSACGGGSFLFPRRRPPPNTPPPTVYNTEDVELPIFEGRAPLSWYPDRGMRVL